MDLDEKWIKQLACAVRQDYVVTLDLTKSEVRVLYCRAVKAS